MSETKTIADLMAESGVRFGTSGARGRVVELTAELVAAYTGAFVAQQRQRHGLRADTPIAIGYDRRASSPAIANAVAQGIARAGHRPIDAGAVPTPALAGWAIERGWPCVMVTGSHIPADRNGLKFYRADGELDKDDEAAIQGQPVPTGALGDAGADAAVDPDTPTRWYLDRFVRAFGPEALAGCTVAAFGHSAVGRELTVRVLSALGATVDRVGDTDDFVAIDTEAIDETTHAAARAWAASGKYAAIVSTDADGDRPLLADERGRWLRGDQVGILCARRLAAHVVVTPVSTSSAVEGCGWFRHVRRTRIGSPYVIAGMQAETGARVFGFEANGGVLLGEGFAGPAGPLPPLRTRDALTSLVALLHAVASEARPLSAWVEDLPLRHGASGLLRHVPRARAHDELQALAQAGPAHASSWLGLGPIEAIDTTDGLRMTLHNGDIVHLRPSGNAPELRCYTESDDAARAEALVAHALGLVADWAG